VLNNDWLDINVLEDYLDGKLDAKAMNRVEREALEDPFVAEALAGLSKSPKRSLQSLSMLQKQLYDRIAGQQQIKKASLVTWQRLSIAATAAVLFVSVSIIFWMRENNIQQMSAKNLNKKVEVTIAPLPEGNSAINSTRSARISSSPETFIAGTPLTGWDKYQAYLRQNNKLLQSNKTKTVTALSFTVNEHGKPESIKIVQSSGSVYDKEAIRLLNNGPGWAQPKQAQERVSIKIEFN
jgi:TonB family protein